MNQTDIGRTILQKRREKNLTREQLAKRSGISVETISKWENGKSLPDDSALWRLWEALSAPSLKQADGEDAAKESAQDGEDEERRSMLRRIRELERQRDILCGLVLIAFGVASGAAAKTTGGTAVQDFIAGVLNGLSVVEMLAGIVIIGRKVLRP